jgi:DNA polymerase sigma
MLLLRPEAEIKIFGSQMTKILTPSSDLDIAIINVPEGDGGLIERLYDLEKIIREKGENFYESQ